MSVTATQALIVAIAGVAVGAVGAGIALWASIRVKRVRDSQRTLLGGGRRDLVDFAVSLQGRVDDLHRSVDEVAAGLARVDRRVDTTVTNTAIVRYDAYEDTGGHQSASLALLDSARTGVVVTAIQGRDYARIYMKELDRPLRSASDTYRWPHVIRLVHYVRVPRTVKRKISRRALFARDNWRCVYCGTSTGRLTLDHVIPRSKGGDSTWENVVTSCAPCNLRKGNRLLHEAHMELPNRPRPPAPVLFIRLATPKIPQRWERYLAPYGTQTPSAAAA